MRPAQPFAEPGDRNGGAKPVGIDIGRIRREHQIGARGTDQGRIGGLLARVGRKILARAELLRIDEQADDHAVGRPVGGFDQRQVPAMDRPHGWNQPDRKAARAPCADHGPGVIGGTDDFHALRAGSGAPRRGPPAQASFARLGTPKQFSGPGKLRSRTSRA